MASIDPAIPQPQQTRPTKNRADSEGHTDRDGERSIEVAIHDDAEPALLYTQNGHHDTILSADPSPSQILAASAPIALFPTSTESAQEGVRAILTLIGEDPDRDGLRDTPARVVKAFAEMTVGYAMNPEQILSRTFAVDHDEIVCLTGIQFHSTCEHHLLPFMGEARIAYLPGKVVGISKLARLVECFSKRLQVQERMTDQIARAIELYLGARGVGVILAAHHLCMGCRGVRQPAATMTTSSMLGKFRDQSVKVEVMELLYSTKGRAQ